MSAERVRATFAGMPITPEDKNWTWVIEARCPDCGFDSPATDPRSVADRVRAQLPHWQRLLADPRVLVRPDDHTWSALEYGCHVRDVFRIFERRLHRMIVEHAPGFANWDQDLTAADERYDLQDPAVVNIDLQMFGHRIADRFDTVGDGEWGRTGLRSDGSAFTIDTFSRYFLHDPTHHLWDVERGYARLAA
jgi:hypothetical protein